ncbi:MAG: hypothetical protein MI919_11750 [Holophagales bacterium]|nr:hypothetical protein [Holophagales bacterium]
MAGGALDLSELGFGDGSAEPSALATAPDPLAERRSRAGRGGSRARQRSGGRSSRAGQATFLRRFITLLGILAAVVVVFGAAYVFSGRDLSGSSSLPGWLSPFDPRPAAGGDSAGAPIEGAAEGDLAGVAGEAGGPDVVAAVDAEPGTVIFDASPWARIESIMDAGGELVVVAGAPASPKRFELPPGEYTLILSHPPTGRERTEVIRVQSRESVELRVAFPTTPEELIRAAGW